MGGVSYFDHISVHFRFLTFPRILHGGSSGCVCVVSVQPSNHVFFVNGSRSAVPSVADTSKRIKAALLLPVYTHVACCVSVTCAPGLRNSALESVSACPYFEVPWHVACCTPALPEHAARLPHPNPTRAIIS